MYDEQAKAELVALCLQPGASVSRLARECGATPERGQTLPGRWPPYPLPKRSPLAARSAASTSRTCSSTKPRAWEARSKLLDAPRVFGDETELQVLHDLVHLAVRFIALIGRLYPVEALLRANVHAVLPKVQTIDDYACLLPWRIDLAPA